MDFDTVLAEELAHIGKTRIGNPRRGGREEVDRDDLAGIALSGGGIRSASFALGILQALVVEKALSRFDYLSTVSGGGYIGSALTWFLANIPGAGLDIANFPLSGPRGGTRSPPVPPPPLQQALDFIRQRGNYLAPSNNLSLMAGVAFVLRGMSATVLVYFAIAFAALLAVQSLLLLGWATLWQPWTAATDGAVGDAVRSGAKGIAIGSLAVFFLLSLVSWASPNDWFRPLMKSGTPSATMAAALPYLVRNVATQWFGLLLWMLLGGLGLAGLLYIGPLLNGSLVDALKPALISGAGAAIAAWGARPKPAAASRIPMLMLAAALVLVGFFWLAQLLSQLLLTAIVDHQGDMIPGVCWSLPVALLIGIVALLFARGIDANNTSLHRFYRDRLMETFLPDPANLASGRWEAAPMADATLLAAMCQSGNGAPGYPGPFHLINTNVVLTGSPHYRFNGRAGDSFVLTPLHLGSDATGWVPTSSYTRRSSAVRGITLATAMATSGAAANPNAGVGGTGITRSRLISVLMTLLNIRLGYWLVNPQHLAGKRARRPPHLLNPAALNMFGTGLRENKTFLQITDGGHFDNTGVYELVRRRCRLIVLSEAGADAGFGFGDLASMIERIRVDFGVNVDFMDGFGLDQLVSANRAAAGYAIARLRYAASGDEGFMLVVKPTLTAGLPEDLYARRAQFPTFPHESTADQFFNEAQFEAYRELGYRLARSAVEDVKTFDRLAPVRALWGL